MIVACIALAVALGGTSYAVIRLPANSVTSKHLKKGAVTEVKIAPNAVTGAKVKNGSLAAVDFAPGQLPAGPAGGQGAKGDKGDKGDTGAPGSARAYAFVKPSAGAGSAPVMVISKGFTSMTHVGTGTYCFAPDPALGISPATAPALTSVEWSTYREHAGAEALWYKQGGGCLPGQYDVRTERITAIDESSDPPTSTHQSDDVAFTIMIP